MKVVVPKSYDSGTRVPILPLVVDESIDKPKSEDMRSFKLLTNPADNTSAKYEMKIRTINGTEQLRTVIKWTKDVHRILAGLNLQNVANKHTIVRELLRGTALTVYNASRTQQHVRWPQIRLTRTQLAMKQQRVQLLECNLLVPKPTSTMTTLLSTH